MIQFPVRDPEELNPRGMEHEQQNSGNLLRWGMIVGLLEDLRQRSAFSWIESWSLTI